MNLVKNKKLKIFDYQHKIRKKEMKNFIKVNHLSMTKSQQNKIILKIASKRFI
jgi:hypothetical protein